MGKSLEVEDEGLVNLCHKKYSEGRRLAGRCFGQYRRLWESVMTNFVVVAF